MVGVVEASLKQEALFGKVAVSTVKVKLDGNKVGLNKEVGV